LSLTTMSLEMSLRCLPLSPLCQVIFIFFFFTNAATTEIYTLSLHDALPIWMSAMTETRPPLPPFTSATAIEKVQAAEDAWNSCEDRKSTRLNSSHLVISYAVFCLKKKNKILHQEYTK